ncbi:branched-chain amino acid ABC transporter permease [Pseudofrankia inefficax]|uniref:Inner-membrane translocator n=1 Tax=Pseudofrankia inefficax (strain DSM 45817 / CECT 9037 / DDB 130130 / EuI1c) TaxID=298654 RepID=E3JCF0_PSEI1|nr:branched-chain amino acid ABC transporter permease [Pseudofrankia inefficax]ADP84739.1 inner-membrane translocator [Pseudofrankia inefficax]
MSAAPTVSDPTPAPASPPEPVSGSGVGSLVTTALFGAKGLRLLGTWVLLSLVLALMTGKDGSPDKPFHAVAQDLLHPRILTFLIIAVVMWVVVALWPLLRSLLQGAVDQARGPATVVTQNRFAPIGANLVLLVLAILAPMFFSTAAQQSMVNDIGIYALLALGLNVVIGYAGMLDLGYIAFFAIGAYATAYFSYKHTSPPLPVHAPFSLNPFFVFPIAFVLAALAGIILGAPTLRLRGDYLAIVTLGFGEIIQLIANNSSWTNGPRGAFGVPHLSVHIGGFNYAWKLDPRPYYYLLLVIIVIVMLALGRLERSRIGRAWAAIREDEIAAEATGVPTLRMKLLAFAIGASVSGFAGVLFASKQFFNPGVFSLQASFLVVTIVIFGGMGNRLGVVVGSVVLQGLAFYLRDKVPATDRYIWFGAVVIVMMIFRPQGVVPSRRRGREIKLAEQGVGHADSLGSAPISEDLAS